MFGTKLLRVGRPWGATLVAVLGAAVVALVAIPTSASAAQFPGTISRLLVTDTDSSTNPATEYIVTVNPDGSNPTDVTYGHYGSVDAAGTKVVSSRSTSGTIQLTNIDGTGSTTIYTAAAGRVLSDVTMSPDGSTVVFKNADATSATPPVVARVNADGTGYTVMSSAFTQILALQYSPDGTMLVLLADAGSGWGIQTLPVSGGAPTMVLAGSSAAWPSWTPDGRIMFVSYVGSVDSLKVMNADGTGVTTLFSETVVGTSSINSAMMSPDGTKVAFNAPYAGRPALWVANVDGTGSTRVRSVGGLGTEMLVWVTTPAPPTTSTTAPDPDPVAPTFTG